MKTCKGEEVIAPSFLISAVDGGEWSPSRPGRFNAGEITSGTHCIGGWLGHTAGNGTLATEPVATDWGDIAVLRGQGSVFSPFLELVKNLCCASTHSERRSSSTTNTHNKPTIQRG
jgi:hypothetical protein